VAEIVAKFFVSLQEKFQVDATRTTCIGFSLGAHICGLVFKYLENQKFARVIGLDPAGKILSQIISTTVDLFIISQDRCSTLRITRHELTLIQPPMLSAYTLAFPSASERQSASLTFSSTKECSNPVAATFLAWTLQFVLTTELLISIAKQRKIRKLFTVLLVHHLSLHWRVRVSTSLVHSCQTMRMP
jgi:hypothetical protein